MFAFLAIDLWPIDPWFYVVGLGATFLIALGKGAFGGGLAILGIPLLALVVDPLDAAIMVAVLVSVMDLFAIQSFGRASWSWPDLKGLLPGLLIGLGLGWAVFVHVNPKIVTLIIGVVTLAFAAHFFLKGRVASAGAIPASRPLAMLAGTVSGFTTFVAHAGGPPITLYLLARGLNKTLFTGTMIAFFTVGNILKLPPYLYLGVQQPHVLAAALMLVPACPLGIWAGRKLHDRLPQARLMAWCYGLLTIAALKLLFDSIRAIA